MKILISELRIVKKVNVDEEIPIDQIEWDAPEYAKLIDSVQVKVEAKLVDNEALIKGDAKTAVQLNCGRCLKNFSVPINGKIQNAINIENGEDIDLTKEARESVLIDVPMHPICKKDCKGICASCGTNKNDDPCKCKGESKDLRWDKLKELKPSN